MAELTRLREENARLAAEVAALRERLARYEEREAGADPLHVAQAVADAFDDAATSTDWICAYWVLTTYAGAPATFAAFAHWANSLPLAEGCMPPCKASLLYKADPVYQRPLYRWEECTTVRPSVMKRRLAIAKRLKHLLTSC